MALPNDADIPLILSRIRPGAGWGWTGGELSDPANLEWRDGVQIEPTLQELEDEWTAIVAENATAESVKQLIKTAYAPLAGTPVAGLTNPQLVVLIEVLCYILGGIDEQTRDLKSAGQWKAALDRLGL